MNFFIVIGCGDNAEHIASMTHDAYGEDAYLISPSAVVVSEDAGVTLKTVKEKILGDEPDSDERGVYFIADFGPYWGYHQQDLWEWMQKRSVV
ncbi:TPA: hypothetical protein ACX6PV_000684 [Photobacterium damselae]